MPARLRLIALLTAVLFFSLGFVTPTGGDLFEVSRNMEIFGRLYTEVNKVYVDETDPTGLMRTGIDAMLAQLDPYTNFYSESQIDLSRLMNSGQYAGIGIEVGRREDKILIIEVQGESPADSAGLLVGDEILAVDNVAVAGAESRTVEEVRNLLLGEKGSRFSLSIKRPGEPAPRELSVVRGGSEVQEENVPYFGLINPEVGYVELSGFMANAGNEVATAVRALRSQSPELKGVVLDLRGNPGGRLDQAVEVSNVFIPQGELITEMRGRTSDSRNKFYTLLPPVDTEIPVVVLINGRSASASEIVAGSIQDLDRGVVIGQRSFGKGLVQNVRPLSFNTQMKVTIAKYYTPSGRCIQAIDYSVRNPDGSVGRIPDSLINSFRTQNGRLVYDGGGIDPDIVIEKASPAPVTQALQAQNLIFDYVSAYVREHDSIAAPRDFRLPETVFPDFVAFVEGQGFAFQTHTEIQLDLLEKSLGEEGYDTPMAAQLEAIRTKLEEQKSADLARYRPEIEGLLEREIIRRYYFHRGAVEASFDRDPELLEAVRLLGDSDRYQAILAGE
ncbi:MAG: S41 family peptidase [Bacteroidetes bacterium]|nr:MAG: S41 family peptidase [Bacteroidota bacterium]